MRNDLRFALRLMLKHAAFSFGIIAALSLGIGANSAMFAVVHSVLIGTLPFRDPEHLVWATARFPDSDEQPFSLPEFLDYRASTTTMEGLAALSGSSMSLVGRGDAERVQGLLVTADLFTLLGAQPRLGRALVAADDRPEAPAVAVLTNALWQRRFGSSPSIIGSSITLNGQAYSVVGVMPKEFPLPFRDVDVIVPLSPGKHQWRDVRGSVSFLRVVGRMRPGVTLAQAQAELSSITAQLKTRFPVDYAQRRGVRLVPLRDRLVRDHRQNLWMLLGAVSVVLLIACTNVASLFLARASTRQRELAIRGALGASRARVTRQLLVEVGVIAAVSGVVGSIVAVGGVRAFIAFGPADLPRLAEIHTDVRILGFTALVTVVAALWFGLVPVLQSSNANLIDSLRDGRGATGSRARARTRGLLVVVEMALAVALLSAAGLLLRSLREIERVEPGFDSGGVLTARLSFPAKRYPDRDRMTAFYETMSTQLRALPGVTSVGAVSILPMSGPLATINFSIDGASPLSVGEVAVANYRMISPDYLQTVKVPLILGHFFDQTERGDGHQVALVNRHLADKFFPSGDAVGRSIRVDDNAKEPRLLEIVGVVGDVKHDNLEAKPTFDVYVPLLQVNSNALVFLRNNQFWAIRTDGDPMRVAEPFRRLLRTIDPNVPAARVVPFDDYVGSTLRQRRFTLRLLGAFAIVAIALVGSGLYALISFWVNERRQEMAIRLALGAAPSAILSSVVGRGLTLTSAGLVVGLLAANAVTRTVQSQFFNIARGDVTTVLAVSLVLLAIALAASLVPALRATRVNPADAMRA